MIPDLQTSTLSNEYAMAGIKTTFLNHNNEKLSASLEMPDGEPIAYAIFAHCFTCSKNILAASRISKALSKLNIAVLRFDFTGLGNSEGDFSNTNFSSNLQDIIAAAKFLESEYEAPTLLVGHSLGGAAALIAAQSIDSVKAIVTIAAPATAVHLKKLLLKGNPNAADQEQIAIRLGGQQFSIRKQFLDDIEQYDDLSHIASLRKALLILHSPVDKVVSIDEAAKIYQAAKHPKSFITLDDADHLLSEPKDAEYAADLIANWSSRYLPKHSQKELSVVQQTLSEGEVLITERNHKFERGIITPHHHLVADEPVSVGGDNRGAGPYDYLLAALGSCTSMTIRMYANHKKLLLDDIKITLKHERVHCTDSEECLSDKGYIDRITRQISFSGDLTEKEQTRLLEIADKCPVHKTLTNHIDIDTTLI